jgi:hypothetical protein
MFGDDIKSHIDELAGYAERLNSLISTTNPLTADDVHATALLISLPEKWLHCLSSLMNKERVSLAKVVTALKQEAYRQKSRHKDTPTPASASVAKSNKPSSKPADQQPPRARFCTFCEKEGQSLSNFRRTG